MTQIVRPSLAAEVPFDQVILEDYDIALVALGYEARSRAVATRLAGSIVRRVALPFECDKVLSYAKNREVLSEIGFLIEEISEAKFLRWWRSELATAPVRNNGVLRVCIDISSVTRSRLARLLEGIMSSGLGVRIEVDFVYSVAVFSEPWESSEVATVCGAVSPFFAGWPSDPDRSVVALIGLGYELEKAIGVLEYLEPSAKILIRPASVDPRFDLAVSEANRDLISSVSAAEVFTYPIVRPTQCLELLDSLIHGVSSEYRVITIPFGPKIFALCCMLLAGRYYPEVGVWRISSESARTPRDQVESGTFIALRVRFDRVEAGSRL